MSYQVPRKVKRHSKRNFSITRFSHPLHDFCCGCALTQDCHSSIWQRRKVWAGCPASPSSHQRAPLLQAANLSLQNSAVAWNKHRYPQRQGEVLGCLLNSSGKEVTAREMRGSYRPLLLCRNAKPCLYGNLLFFMGKKTPFLWEQRVLVFLTAQRVCAFARSSMEIRTVAVPDDHTLLLCLLLFFCLSWQFPNSLFAMLGWPRASLPAQILGSDPISSSAAAALSHWMESWKIPAILAKSGGLRGTTWKRAEGTRGQQDCALSTTALTTLQFLGELAHHDQEEGTQRHVWGLVLHLLPGFVLRFDPSDSSSLQISPGLTPCPFSGLQQDKIHSGCKSQLTSSRAHRALHKQYLIQKGPQILLFCEILGIT